MSLPTQQEEWARCPPGLEEMISVNGNGDPSLPPSCVLSLDTYPAEELPIDENNNLAPDLISAMEQAEPQVSRDTTTNVNNTQCVDCGAISSEAKQPESGTEVPAAVTQGYFERKWAAKASRAMRMRGSRGSRMASRAAMRMRAAQAIPARRNMNAINKPFMTFDAHLMVPDRLKDWQEGQRPPVFNRDYDVSPYVKIVPVPMKSRRIGDTPMISGASRFSRIPSRMIH